MVGQDLRFGHSQDQPTQVGQGSGVLQSGLHLRSPTRSLYHGHFLTVHLGLIGKHGPGGSITRAHATPWRSAWYEEKPHLDTREQTQLGLPGGSRPVGGHRCAGAPATGGGLLPSGMQGQPARYTVEAAGPPPAPCITTSTATSTITTLSLTSPSTTTGYRDPPQKPHHTTAASGTDTTQRIASGPGAPVAPVART